MPRALAFSTHPDNDAGLDIPVQIRFSDYKSFQGVQVATHIQKLLQGSLLLDFEVSAAEINSGLADSEFAVPATVAPVSPPATGGAR